MFNVIHLFNRINKNYKLFTTYSYSPSPSTSYTMGSISLNTRRCIAKIACLLTNLLPRIVFVSTSRSVAVFSLSSPPTQTLCLSIKLSKKLCRQQQVVKTLSQTLMSQNRITSSVSLEYQTCTPHPFSHSPG